MSDQSISDIYRHHENTKRRVRELEFEVAQLRNISHVPIDVVAIVQAELRKARSLPEETPTERKEGESPCAHSNPVGSNADAGTVPPAPASGALEKVVKDALWEGYECCGRHHGFSITDGEVAEAWDCSTARSKILGDQPATEPQKP